LAPPLHFHIFKRFQQLLATVGSDRFVFGTGQPLRIPEAGVAKLDLLELELEARRAIESGNVRALMTTRSLPS